MLKYNIIFTLLISILLFISCSDYQRGVDTPPIKHHLPIGKEQNKWKVKTPKVTNGDTLVWVAPDSSDLSFQFPGNISRFLKPLNDKDELTDGYLKNLTAKDSLRLVVKRNAPRNRVIEYAIFVISDGKYVEGSTPPEVQFEW